MTRSALILLLLLLLSNAVWVAAWLGEENEGNVFDVDTAALERQVDELNLQLADLRRTEPVLIGTGEGGPARPPAGAAGEGPPAGSGSGPEEKNSDLAAASAAAEAAAERGRATQQAYAVARDAATVMLKKVMQVEDPALRDAGLAEMAAALAGNDSKLIEYTLSALFSLRDTAVDRGAFLGAVRQHLDSEDGGIRRSALYALQAVDPDGGHRGLFLESAADADPRVRGHVARLLALSENRTFQGESAATALALLSDGDAAVRKGTLRGLADARVSPELAQQLIEMAADSPERRDALHFGLSRLKNKSRPVVDALLAHLEDDDHKVRARAHWGLQRAVGEEQQLHVAEGYAARLGKFLNPKSQREALKLIVRYGDDRLAPELERFAANEMVDEDVRALAGKAASYLRDRKPR